MTPHVRYTGPSRTYNTKLFRIRIKIRLKFKKEESLDHFPIYVQVNMICVYIGMVNVVLDLKCIGLKYILERINYIKVNPVI